MSVNDIVTSGAKPLFFLDYFATGHLDVDVAEKVVIHVLRVARIIDLSTQNISFSYLPSNNQVIKGIVDGCQQSDCVLLGGEVLLTLSFAVVFD